MPETITQLVISAIHNTNQIILTKIAVAISEQQGSYIPIEVVNGTPLCTSKSAALPAILMTLEQKQNEHGNLPLVTIMADFNLGYSGLNVSPLSKLVANIENLPAVACIEADGSVLLKKYKYVKTAVQLHSINTTTDIPVRIFTTGGGGMDVSPQPELLNIDRDKARKKFGFEGKDIIGFCGSLRAASGTPRTPSVSSRRLDPSSPLASPQASPSFGSAAKTIMSLSRATSASLVSTESSLSSISIGTLRGSSCSSFSESASPSSPIADEKTDLTEMGPLNLFVSEKGNAFDDMKSLLRALPPASPNTSPKRTSSPKRPSPIKTTLDAPIDRNISDSVTRALFK